MFRSERVLRIICFEPVFLAFNPGRLSAKPYRTRVFFLRIFLPARKKTIVLGHFPFQFELWFFLIWSWSIPVGASEIRCSTRVFAVSKTAATDHGRHESTKCEQDSKSVEPQGSVGSNPTRSARNLASSRFSRLLAFLFQFCTKPKPLSIASAEVSFEL